MSVQGWPTNNQTLKMPGGLAVQESSAYQVRPRVGRRIGRFLDTVATLHFKSRPFSGRRGGGGGGRTIGRLSKCWAAPQFKIRQTARSAGEWAKQAEDS